MTSKAEYLKKYLSKDDSGDFEAKRKAKKKKKVVKKHSNFAILDDDIDWRAVAPKHTGDSDIEEDDPDEAPVVAEFRDETLPTKWQPMGPGSDPEQPPANDPSDLSPPRRSGSGRMGGVACEDLSPPRRVHDSASDLSPPRRRKRTHPASDDSPATRKYTPADTSPPRRSRWDRRISPHSGDISPPRKPKRHDSPDAGPPRRSRWDRRSPPKSDDVSPPRKPRRHDSPDAYPPRRSRWDRSPDLSPPRKRAGAIARHGSPADSRPPRRRHDSPPDVSVSRSDGNGSPPLRRTRLQQSPDLSPPRKRSRRRHDSLDDETLSPPRKGRHDSPDISPPQKGRHDCSSSPADLSPPRRRAKEEVIESKGEVRMASGVKAGLQSAEVLKEENFLARERQTQFYQTLDSGVSGKHAETVYRDKAGRKIDPKLERVKKREEERRKMEEDATFMEWGRGVAQGKMAQDRRADELYEMSKPLARYVDDEDLEKMLREREREGDPMLAFMRKKTKLHAERRGKPKKEKLTYKGSFPLNRFGLRPGYRWDGVDRSNGFEKSWFSRESNRKAVADEAYMWSVEDM